MEAFFALMVVMAGAVYLVLFGASLGYDGGKRAGSRKGYAAGKRTGSRKGYAAGRRTRRV
ncbi:hypothetical protein [Halochromatium roseum]|uniref:hypothetical protein n=1 Tax=Halochromatium roseum TaxID=391920 RepID=UPI0019112D58|nr:hypothetical protein [Halochromatium roseum]MBK5938249.1 hypothetical protein [Halochromatium roseum]